MKTKIPKEKEKLSSSIEAFIVKQLLYRKSNAVIGATVQYQQQGIDLPSLTYCNAYNVNTVAFYGCIHIILYLLFYFLAELCASVIC